MDEKIIKELKAKFDDDASAHRIADAFSRFIVIISFVAGLAAFLWVSQWLLSSYGVVRPGSSVAGLRPSRIIYLSDVLLSALIFATFVTAAWSSIGLAYGLNLVFSPMIDFVAKSFVKARNEVRGSFPREE